MLSSLATQAARRLIAQKAIEVASQNRSQPKLRKSSAIGGYKNRGSRPKLMGGGFQTARAPAAVGSVQQGPKFSFRTVTRNGLTGLSMMFNLVWCAVETQSTGNTVLIKQDTTGANSLDFDPDNTLLMPSPITNFVRNFTRWCLESLEFDYLGACPTSTGGELAFGWDTDPGDSVPAATNPTAVMLLANSMGGAPWCNMTMKVPVDKTLRYTFNSVASSSMTVAESRQSSAGSICGSSFGIAASSILGWLRIRGELCVFELNPTAVQSTLLDVRRVDLCAGCRHEASARFPMLERGFARRDAEVLSVGPCHLRRTDSLQPEEKKEAVEASLQKPDLPQPTTAVPLLATAAGVSVPSGWTLVKSPEKQRGDRLTMPASLLSYRD